MFCWHQWGVVVDRVQTCIKCGKARVVECPHVWEKSKIFTVTVLGIHKGENWVFICKKCGEVKTERVGAYYD